MSVSDFSTTRALVMKHCAMTVAGDLGDVRLGLIASSDSRTILDTRLDSSVDDLMMVDEFR